MGFRGAISDDLKCDKEKIVSISSPQEFIKVVQNYDPELLILDYNYVGKEDLFGYYTITKWYEIQLIVTDIRNRLSFGNLLKQPYF